MNISLPPELARFVREKVESGLYSSASEVVREALRRLATPNRETATAGPSVDHAKVRAAIARLSEARDALASRGVSLSADEIRAAIDEGRA
jgi:antitoxin ParD1/3/4